jgi:hypothetical protein
VRGILAELAFPLETETFAFGKHPKRQTDRTKNIKILISNLSALFENKLEQNQGRYTHLKVTSGALYQVAPLSLKL